MAKIEVLLPTYNRVDSLIMALSGLSGQTLTDFHLILADQSSPAVDAHPVVQALFAMIRAKGGSVEVHRRGSLKGIAEQRDFLLKRASGDFVLFLDDDVWMEPWVLERMVATIEAQGCGFVGAFGAGLDFLDDIRPEQQKIEYWDGQVRPEVVEPGSQAWERWNLHRAANLFHIAQSLPPGETRLYKVAWLGACTLYDRRKTLTVGGFSFWKRLPRYHSGEEVVVQNLLMRRWGGCGIVPSGTYFSGMPSTVLNQDGKVDGHALDLLPELVARYVPQMESV